jgi:hypothetical protein
MKKLIVALALILALAPAALSLAEQAEPTSEWLYAEDAGSTEGWTEATDEDAEDSIEEDETNEDETLFQSALQVYGCLSPNRWTWTLKSPARTAKNTGAGRPAQHHARAGCRSPRPFLGRHRQQAPGHRRVRGDRRLPVHTAQDRAIDATIGEKELTVDERTDDKITYTLAVNRVDSEGNVTSADELKYVLEKIDGGGGLPSSPIICEREDAR